VAIMAIDILERGDLPFPHSLPEFQRLFPDEAACTSYLERARWGNGFVCSHCGASDEPYRFSNRLGVLRCRHCNHDTSLTAGTVMERSHTPLSVWFWAAYLVASQTPGMSAVQFQRQLGLSRYETVWCQLSWPVSDNYLGRLAPLFFRGRVSCVLVWEGVPLVGPSTGRSP
jgi:hypothetical protein